MSENQPHGTCFGWDTPSTIVIVLHSLYWYLRDTMDLLEWGFGCHGRAGMDLILANRSHSVN